VTSFHDLFERQKRHFATGVTRRYSPEKHAELRLWFEY
jgi:hypothetical protein